jgi:hypothetical protein
MGESSQPRFVVKPQVVVEDRSQTKKFIHLDTFGHGSTTFVKFSCENKRRLVHFLGDKINDVMCAMTRKRDDVISDRIKESIAQADPMLDARSVNISRQTLPERQEAFLKAGIPEVLSVSFDNLKIDSNAEPIEPYSINVAASHIEGKDLAFEISPDNLAWLAIAMNVSWNHALVPDDNTLDMVYKYIDVDWDLVKVSYYTKGARANLTFYTWLDNDDSGKKKSHRMTVPKSVLDKFRDMDQASANAITEIARKVAKVAQGGIADANELDDQSSPPEKP